MKRIFVFLCLALLFTGCGSKKEKKTVFGPLSEIQQYQVIPLFPPDVASDRTSLFNHFIGTLEKLGTVHISTDYISHTPASSAVLVITIDEFEQSKTGSIKIFAEGEVLINKYKTSCDVWTTLYRDPTLPYPVDGDDGIVFRRDPTAESPDVKAVATQMVAQFAEQYRRDNPDSKPIFYVYPRFS
jgi:hypothetical protein